MSHIIEKVIFVNILPLNCDLLLFIYINI